MSGQCAKYPGSVHWKHRKGIDKLSGSCESKVGCPESEKGREAEQVGVVFQLRAEG